MRNEFPGPCYRCGNIVRAGEGHFERVSPSKPDKLGEQIRGKKWLLQHAVCAIKYRGTNHTFAKRKTLSDDFQDVV